MACLCQRPQQRNGSGRITTRVGHEPRLSNFFAMPGFKLFKTKDPIRVGPVGGGGIDQPCIAIGNHRHSFACAIVRQAQDSNIGIIEQLRPHLFIVPVSMGHGQHFHIITALHPGENLQTSGAMFAVDINFQFHNNHLFSTGWRIFRNQIPNSLNHIAKALIQFLSPVVVATTDLA